jgi:hypothetical protein
MQLRGFQAPSFYTEDYRPQYLAKNPDRYCRVERHGNLVSDWRKRTGCRALSRWLRKNAAIWMVEMSTGNVPARTLVDLDARSQAAPRKGRNRARAATDQMGACVLLFSGRPYGEVMRFCIRRCSGPVHNGRMVPCPGIQSIRRASGTSGCLMPVSNRSSGNSCSIAMASER